MAAEVVETSRVYARVNARIDPAWILDKAAHLLKRNHDNPHWEKRAAQVSAFEQTSLYGLIISAQQKVNYARVNPIEAREIFIRNALVQADFECKADFFKHNQQLVHQLETLEAKSRRQNILVDDETLFRFYDTHIPAEVCNGASFNAWLKTLDADSRKQLFFTRDSLMQHDATHITAHQFPDHLQLDDVAYPLEYHFDPSQQRDGITLITPLAALNAIKATRCEWLVPGMLHSKLTELIRCLPKSLRRNFIPATDFAEACVQALQPGDTPLTTSLAAQLKKITGHDIPYDAWRPELVSAHLFMNFRVIDANGKTLAESRNLAALKQQLQAQSATAPPVVMVKQASSEPKEVGAEALDELKAEIEYNTQGIQLKAYPALVREANRVTLQYLDSRASAQSAHHEGLRQLFCNALGEQLRHLRARLPDIQQLCLLYSALGNCKSLQDDIIDCVIDRLFMTQAINSSAEFQTSLDAGRSELHAAAANLCRLLREILGSYCDIQQHIKKLPLHALDTASDIQQQLDALFPARFLLAIEFAWLEHYPRYLAAISKRLEKLGDNAARDRQLRLHFAALWQAYGKRQQQLVAQQRKSAQLNHYRWLLEEYRVSLFAQTLKTRVPVSEKRLQQYWKEIADA
jgi:ATP-dependent helicase HrpA